MTVQNIKDGDTVTLKPEGRLNTAAKPNADFDKKPDISAD